MYSLSFFTIKPTNHEKTPPTQIYCQNLCLPDNHFTVALMFNSCKKDSKTSEPENSEVATSKKPGTGRYPGPCPYTCEDPRCSQYQEPPPGCSGGGGGGGQVIVPKIYLENFFSTYDTTILKNPDSLQVQAYMISKNQSLIDILSINFPQTYKRSELNSEDVFITWAGLIHMLAEGQGMFSSTSNTQAKKIIDWECVGDLILGFFDVASLVEDYAYLIKTGGSWSSVRGLLWRTLKRYGGWMAAAGLIYDISRNCF